MQLVESQQLLLNKKTEPRERFILPKPEEYVHVPIQPPERMGKRRYKCMECLEVFRSYRQRKDHTAQYHNDIINSMYSLCDYCCSLFATRRLLEAHVIEEHSDKKCVCRICNTKFINKGALVQHFTKKHPNMNVIFYCTICSPVASQDSKVLLIEHFQKEHQAALKASGLEKDEFQITEEFLDETLNCLSFDNMELSLSEMLASSPPDQQISEQYQCPKCKIFLYNIKDLFKHLGEKHQMKIFVCVKCDKKFDNADVLLEHKQSHDNNKVYNYECADCSKTFKSHAAWNYHMDMHSPHTTYECPYCFKTFYSSSNLKKHVRGTHSTIRKHTCFLCDKSFGTMDHLKKHVLSVHDKERKFICHICGKAFAQAGHLKQHIEIHTIGKNISCKYCERKFWKKIDLKKHLEQNHEFDQLEINNYMHENQDDNNNEDEEEEEENNGMNDTNDTNVQGNILSDTLLNPFSSYANMFLPEAVPNMMPDNLVNVELPNTIMGISDGHIVDIEEESDPNYLFTDETSNTFTANGDDVNDHYMLALQNIQEEIVLEDTSSDPLSCIAIDGAGSITNESIDILMIRTLK